jgi:hypothetical protein
MNNLKVISYNADMSNRYWLAFDSEGYALCEPTKDKIFCLFLAYIKKGFIDHQISNKTAIECIKCKIDHHQV